MSWCIVKTNTDKTVALVDRTLTKRVWWTSYDDSVVMVWSNKEAAEKKAASLHDAEVQPSWSVLSSIESQYHDKFETEDYHPGHSQF